MVAESDSPAGTRGLSPWLTGIATAVFDLELGPKIVSLYPEGCLDEQSKATVAFHSFPDSVSYGLGARHSVRDRYVFCRQIQDERYKRGADQRALVVVSLRQYRPVLLPLVQAVGPQCLAQGLPVVQQVWAELEGWPPPGVAAAVKLPLDGITIAAHVVAPRRQPEPGSDGEGGGGADGGAAGGPVGSSVRAGPLVHAATNGHGPGQLQGLEDSLANSLHRLSADAGGGGRGLDGSWWAAARGGFGEICLLQHLGLLLPQLWTAWEVLLTAQPLMFLADSPQQASAGVAALLSLVQPLRLPQLDYRPYFTVHDPTCRRLLRQHGGAAPPPLVGVTNPHVAKSLLARTYYGNALALPGRAAAQLLAAGGRAAPPPCQPDGLLRRLLSANPGAGSGPTASATFLLRHRPAATPHARILREASAAFRGWVSPPSDAALLPTGSASARGGGGGGPAAAGSSGVGGKGAAAPASESLHKASARLQRHFFALTRALLAIFVDGGDGAWAWEAPWIAPGPQQPLPPFLTLLPSAPAAEQPPCRLPGAGRETALGILPGPVASGRKAGSEQRLDGSQRRLVLSFDERQFFALLAECKPPAVVAAVFGSRRALSSLYRGFIDGASFAPWMRMVVGERLGVDAELQLAPGRTEPRPASEETARSPAGGLAALAARSRASSETFRVGGPRGGWEGASEVEMVEAFMALMPRLQRAWQAGGGRAAAVARQLQDLLQAMPQDLLRSIVASPSTAQLLRDAGGPQLRELLQKLQQTPALFGGDSA